MVRFMGHAAAAAVSFLLSLTSPQQQEQNISTKSTSTLQYSNLVHWLNDTFPDSYISPSIHILPSPRGGHGAFARTSISKDELIFDIPREACITSSLVLEDEDCGKTFQALMDKAGRGSFTVALAGYLAKEYLCHSEEGQQSKFGPYLETLPWERGWNGQDHVLFWSEEDVSLYLRDSLCWTESTDLREEVQLACKILNSIIGPSVLKARGEYSDVPIIPFLSFTKPPPPKLTDPVPKLTDTVIGAFAILLSRSFDDDYDSEIKDEDAERLIPLLDMLNHDAHPSIRYFTNNSTGSVEVRARRDIDEDEELYNRYREEEENTMPPHRFFSRFGFVPGLTNNDGGVRGLLKDKSSVFFAKRKEV